MCCFFFKIEEMENEASSAPGSYRNAMMARVRSYKRDIASTRNDLVRLYIPMGAGKVPYGKGLILQEGHCKYHDRFGKIIYYTHAGREGKVPYGNGLVLQEGHCKYHERFGKIIYTHGRGRDVELTRKILQVPRRDLMRLYL